MFSRASTSLATLAGLGLATLAMLAGCEGGASTAASPDGGISKPDGSSGSLGDVFGPPSTPGGKPDSATIEVRAPMPPPVITGAMKILPKGAQFLGGITVGCSYGQASTDAKARWCAFSLPGVTLSKAELWVMNMSKVPAKCDGSTPDCIRLTENLFTDTPTAGPTFPTAHRFYGDTLIYHADAKSSSTQAYAGPIYAWQPGWPAGKKISATDNAFRCVGHAKASVAICLENLSTTDPLTFDLFAGKIGTAPVVKIATILPTHPVAMTSQWGAGFTADAKYFVYSTALPPVPPGKDQIPETLFYIATDMIGTGKPAQVGDPAVSNWDISPDYTKWYYMKDFNYSDTAPSGTLYMSDFPAGTNPVKLASSLLSGGNVGGVAGYDVVPTKDGKALGFVSLVQKFTADMATGKVTDEYRIIKNPAASLEDKANVLPVLENSPTIPSNSPDLRYGWYFKERNATLQGITDSHIVRNDGSGECALSSNATSSIFGAPFTDSANLTFWIDNYDQDTDTGDGMLANPADCSGIKRFSTKTDWWFVKGDEQILYADDVDQSTSTLKVAKLVNGDLGPPLVIQKQVERSFRILLNQDAVLFRIESSSPTIDGLYYYSLTGGGGASDAGVADAATGQ